MNIQLEKIKKDAEFATSPAVLVIKFKVPLRRDPTDGTTASTVNFQQPIVVAAVEAIRHVTEDLAGTYWEIETDMIRK